MHQISKQEALSKVPEVTLVFWIIKITATTLGETGGDSVTMTLDWGYLTGTAIFGLYTLSRDVQASTATAGREQLRQCKNEQGRIRERLKALGENSHRGQLMRR